MGQQCILSFDKRFAMTPETDDFPFTVELSLAPLLAFWQQTVPHELPEYGAVDAQIRQALKQAPELLEPIEDVSIIAKHKALVDVLMTAAFPRASWNETYAAALAPFQMQSFYATPSFERLLLTDEGHLYGRVNVDAQTVAQVRLLHVYAFILWQVYGMELDFEYPLILTASDPNTGLDRHFRMNFDGSFLQVKTVGEVKPLTVEETQYLRANLADPQVLMELMPPEQFILHGFAVLNAVEVTDQEVLSSLKRDLIEKESIISNARFQALQHKLRTLFKKPDLLFGLAAFQGDHVFMLTYNSNIEYG
jgi:hypothetical protein